MHDVVRFIDVFLKLCEPRQIDECVGQHPYMSIFSYQLFQKDDLLCFLNRLFLWIPVL